MADFDGIIQPSAEWADIPSLSNTALALGGTAGAGVMNTQATALAKRTNYLYNYSVTYNATNHYVGVNTASPQAQLDVSVLDNTVYSSSSSGLANPKTVTQLTQTSNTSGTQAFQTFYVANGGGLWFQGPVANGGYVAPFVFGSRTGATSYSEVARFDSNLNFGFGTTTPVSISNYKIMDIRGPSGAFYYGGNVSTNRSFRVGYSASNDALELNAISNNGVMIKTLDTSRIFVDSSGTVGVNTTTTSGGTGNAAVEGKMIVYQGSSNVPSMLIPYPGSAYAGLKIVHQSTNTAGASDRTDFKIRPSYTSGIATGSDQAFIRVVNTFPRTYADVTLNPDGGNVGIGIEPSTWTTYKALEISSNGNSMFGVSGQTGITQNAFLNSTWKYANTGGAARYTQSGGYHVWHYASSGTSGTDITWLEGMRLDGSNGNLGIKKVNPTLSVDISATDAIRIPVGTTVQQPTATTSNGGIRVNSTTSNLEMCISNAWKSVGGLLNVQIFKVAGSYTYTPTTGTNSIIVEVVGGGGAGGGAIAGTTGFGSVGGGGGAGGYARSRITSGFSGQTVTVGATGVAVISGNGGGGGTSSFGSLVVAGGGGGGFAGSAGNTVAGITLHGSGGSAITGDVLAGGAPGTIGIMTPANNGLGGHGGNSFFGGGGNGALPFSVSSTGGAGQSYGAGGGGGASIVAATPVGVSGGAGASGAVIIYEYIS